MSLMYIVLALIWIVLAAMHWRELLYMQCASMHKMSACLGWLWLVERGLVPLSAHIMRYVIGSCRPKACDMS